LGEIDPNFACFWPQIFKGMAPEFFDLDYKAHPASDHMATFHSNPRELEDPVAKYIIKYVNYK